MKFSFRRYVFPFRRFRISTTWSPEDIARELGTRLDRQASDVDIFFRVGFGGAGRWGWASTKGFKFFVALPLFGGSGAVADATIRRAGHGADVEGTVRLYLPAVIMLGTWMALTSAAALVAAATAIVQRQPLALIALLPPLFGLCFSGFIYGKQAFAAEKLLFDLLPPTQPPPTPEGAYR